MGATQALVISQLRAAAVRYCAAGWPILPSRPPENEQLICQRGPADPTTAGEWWSDQPYGIACRTGERFDTLQLPPWLGERVLPTVEHYGAVMVLERSLSSVWQFLVTPGSPSIPDLPRHSGARLLGKGETILLPPTPTVGGAARWIARPTLPETKLPHSLHVQWAVVRATTAVRHERQQRVR